MAKPKAKSREAIRAVVVLSDLHSGSTVALMPPEFVTREGQTINPNPLQRWLWDCWNDAWEWAGGLLGASPFGMVLNGDLIEGVHHGTKQVISPDTNDHVDCAIRLLEPHTKRAARTWVVTGTECHTNNSETNIGLALGLERNPESPNSLFPRWDRLTMDIAGVRCVFRHHIPTACRAYLESSQYSIQMGNEIIESVRNGELAPKVLCAAHRHRFGFWDDGSSVVMVSPPWQALTRHGHKVVPSARTKPGLFILDWRNRDDGELPQVHSRLYDAPKPQAVVV